MKAILDIGNSKIKIKIGDSIHSFHYLAKNEKEIIDLIISNNINKLFFSSVSTQGLAFIKEIVTKINSEQSIELIDASLFLNAQKKVNFDNITGMGNDRKFGLIAASYLANPPIITIDCGTAITINILDEKKIALGGIIMTGSYTQAKALQYFTSNLPEIEFELNNSICGNNTKDAINAGINVATIGGIKYAVEQIQKFKLQNKSPNIFFTGGYGQDVMNRTCLNNSQFVEGLVILGIEKTINNL